jgi:hypothetical protein
VWAPISVGVRREPGPLLLVAPPERHHCSPRHPRLDQSGESTSHGPLPGQGRLNKRGIELLACELGRGYGLRIRGRCSISVANPVATMLVRACSRVASVRDRLLVIARVA